MPLRSRFHLAFVRRAVVASVGVVLDPTFTEPLFYEFALRLIRGVDVDDVRPVNVSLVPNSAVPAAKETELRVRKSHQSSSNHFG
jgi:hypothetical protein